MPQALKPLCLIQFWSLGEFPFLHIGPLGKLELASHYESEKVENLLEQNGLNGLQMVQFEYPRHRKPLVSFNFEIG